MVTIVKKKKTINNQMIKDFENITKTRVYGAGKKVVDKVADVGKDLGTSALDATSKSMKRLDGQIRIVRSNVASKVNISRTLAGELRGPDFAYMLAQDDLLRRTTNNIAQGILHPTPLKSLKSERTSVYLDFGMGLSTFWDEIRTPQDSKVDDMATIDSMIMNLDLGLDPDISPHMRKAFLKEAGIREEQIEEFVSFKDFQKYEREAESVIREYHMDRLGYKSEDLLSDEDKLILNTLVDDSMATGISEMSQQIYVPTDMYTYGDVRPFEEIYGVSAEELQALFGDEDEHGLTASHFPEYVNGYSMNEDEPIYGAIREFNDIHTASIEMNEHHLNMLYEQQAMLYEQEAGLQEYQDVQLSPEDLMEFGGRFDDVSLSDDDLESLENHELER